MAKKNETEEEYVGDPSTAWNSDGDDTSYSTPKKGSSRASYASLGIDEEDPLDTVPNESNKPIDFSNDPIINADVFKNRREMAWISLWVMLGLIGFLLVFLLLILGLFLWKPEIMKLITSDYKTYLDWSATFIGWGFSALSAVILAYMGVSAYFYNSYLKNVKK